MPETRLYIGTLVWAGESPRDGTPPSGWRIPRDARAWRGWRRSGQRTWSRIRTLRGGWIRRVR
eukprot:9017653-Pyramimonas_sp.AAC.1